ncbi:hypothetical protein A1F99_061420 [Pyrenophora tritici-repentis]|nr:hypothetical protein A1F99_061420 [Pyrenophora tritici-repentis]
MPLVVFDPRRLQPHDFTAWHYRPMANQDLSRHVQAHCAVIYSHMISLNLVQDTILVNDHELLNPSAWVKTTPPHVRVSRERPGVWLIRVADDQAQMPSPEFLRRKAL